ncbi:DUF5682 family protein [Streptomyces xanthophaeus]
MADPRDVVDALAASRTPYLLGVRHHSPALAAVVPQLLDASGADVVCVELPADFQPWLEHLADPETEAPVALAGTGAGGRLAFYPFADFSPELAAIRWARRSGASVVCCDLPLGSPGWTPADRQPTAPVSAPVVPSRSYADALAAAGTGRDGDDLWDRAVEVLAPGCTPEAVRRAALGVGWALREDSAVPSEDLAREAHMREVIAAEAATGRRVAAVIGAFHAPALTHPPTDAVRPTPAEPNAGRDGRGEGPVAPPGALSAPETVPATSPATGSAPALVPETAATPEAAHATSPGAETSHGAASASGPASGAAPVALPGTSSAPEAVPAASPATGSAPSSVTAPALVPETAATPEAAPATSPGAETSPGAASASGPASLGETLPGAASGAAPASASSSVSAPGAAPVPAAGAATSPGAPSVVAPAPAPAASAVTSLVPYSYDLLDSRSGYPAGIRDPLWQQAVLRAAGDPVKVREAASVAVTGLCRELRRAGHTAGTGEAAETLRLACDLAVLRGLPDGSYARGRTCDLARGRDLAWGRVRVRACVPRRDLARGRVRGRARVRVLVRERARCRARACGRGRDFARGAVRGGARARARGLGRDLARAVLLRSARLPLRVPRRDP